MPDKELHIVCLCVCVCLVYLLVYFKERYWFDIEICPPVAVKPLYGHFFPKMLSAK